MNDLPQQLLGPPTIAAKFTDDIFGVCHHQVPHDNVERFSFGGAVHRSPRLGTPFLGKSAPVSEKRVALKRSPCRQGYGH